MSEKLTLEAFLDSIRKTSEKTDPKETAQVQDTAPDPIGLSPCMHSAINSALYNHLEVNFAENADIWMNSNKKQHMTNSIPIILSITI